MTPLQQRMRYAVGDPHRALHHLEGPAHLGQGATVVIGQPQIRLALQITFDKGVDCIWRVAAHQFYGDAHPIRKRRRNYTVKYRPNGDRIPIESYLLKPWPPMFEAIDLDYYLPHLGWPQVKVKGAPVSDMRSLRHPSKARCSGLLLGLSVLEHLERPGSLHPPLLIR